MDNHTLGLIGKIVAMGFWASFALLFFCLTPIMYWLDKRKEREAVNQSYAMFEDEPKWISVEERLPEDGECIGDWFWVKRQGAVELMYGAWQKWKDPHEFSWQDPYTVGDHEGIWTENYDDITHWMLLVPPEEGS